MAKKVSIQGDKSSFHDIAAKQYFGDDYQSTFCDSFTDTIQALTGQYVDYALCAIENSLYGSINDVYDLILRNDCHIVGEIYLRIEQCLIGLPGSSIAAIRAVYSHPVAIAQCQEFLDRNLGTADRYEYHDTAASVKMLTETGDKTIAAIASQQAAELYGASVLARSIETNKENYTRFVVLSRSVAEPTVNANKSSLVIETTHQPGVLHTALGTFAARSINLTKLQSRPLVGKAWHYMFYIDIGTSVTDEACVEALGELTDQGCTVRVLGSYRNGLEDQSV